MRGYQTSKGTSFLGQLHGKADSDGRIVQLLRASGAIIVGKTNMHEMGMGTTGFNLHWGTPRNPYDTGRYTGGSSSGSAAAVAAGLGTQKVGTFVRAAFPCKVCTNTNSPVCCFLFLKFLLPWQLTEVVPFVFQQPCVVLWG